MVDKMPMALRRKIKLECLVLILDAQILARKTKLWCSQLCLAFDYGKKGLEEVVKVFKDESRLGLMCPHHKDSKCQDSDVQILGSIVSLFIA